MPYFGWLIWYFTSSFAIKRGRTLLVSGSKGQGHNDTSWKKHIDAHCEWHALRYRALVMIRRSKIGGVLFLVCLSSCPLVFLSCLFAYELLKIEASLKFVNWNFKVKTTCMWLINFKAKLTQNNIVLLLNIVFLKYMLFLLLLFSWLFFFLWKCSWFFFNDKNSEVFFNDNIIHVLYFRGWESLGILIDLTKQIWKQKWFYLIFLTGSRDSKLALWRVDMADNDCDETVAVPSTSNSIQVPDYAITTPVVSRLCEKAQKVRALAYHDDRKARFYYILLVLWCTNRICTWKQIECVLDKE